MEGACECGIEPQGSISPGISWMFNVFLCVVNSSKNVKSHGSLWLSVQGEMLDCAVHSIIELFQEEKASLRYLLGRNDYICNGTTFMELRN